MSITTQRGTILDKSEKEKVVIHSIRSTEVKNLWGLILPWIEMALEHGKGEYLAEDILAAIEAEKMFLLVGFNKMTIVCCAVVEVHRWPRKTALHVVITGGITPSTSYGYALAMKFEEGAKLINADFITGYNYPAMARFLRRFGYGLWYTVVGREIGNESTH